MKEINTSITGTEDTGRVYVGTYLVAFTTETGATMLNAITATRSLLPETVSGSNVFICVSVDSRHGRLELG